MKNPYDIHCNIAHTLNIIGDKWTLLIVKEIMKGKETYKEILEALDGISTNLLSKRLKNLERDEIVETELYQKHPPRFKYILTNKGRELSEVLYSLIIWGEKNLDVCKKKLSHSECGHSLDHQYYCPHCDQIVVGDEISINDSGRDYSSL